MNERAATTQKAGPSSTVLAAGGLLQRKCDCGNNTMAGQECEECGKKKLQRKLSIGASDDPLELEADRIADEVMRKPAHSAVKGTPPRIQRFTTRATGDADTAPASVDRVLASSGRPLEPALQQDMGQRFGYDFSQVRVHTGSAAEQSAREVNARAYTVGRNIVFGAGRFSPKSQAGRRLLAHELTHVVQQTGSDGIGTSLGDRQRTRSNNFPTHTTRVQSQYNAARLQRQTDVGNASSNDGKPGCRVGAGIPNTTCSTYAANNWWLPSAYVNNATCACTETPNSPTANCVRKGLQDRLASTSGWVKAVAAAQKGNDNPLSPLYPSYQAFVQAFLTPQIYRDHRDAYAACCCPSGPAAYPAWVGVTSVPLPCAGVGAAIRYFGSCHGTPGTW